LHQVASAREKIERADKHILDFESGINDFLREYGYRLVPDTDSSDAQKGHLLRPERPLPEALVCTAGDAVHNLRSALDHLAFSVATHNQVPAKVRNSASFPTWKNWDAFNSAIKEGEIPQLAPGWGNFLSFIEPYNGGTGAYLRTVNVLDNIDKHRSLIVLAMQADKYRRVGSAPVIVERGIPLEKGVKLSVNPADPNDNLLTQIRVSFGEGSVPGLDPYAWAHEILRISYCAVGVVIALATSNFREQLFPDNP
jgi:hypothetical protein